MLDEYWATFSIYDHRTKAYRQSLLLFDRVVIPVPTAPYKSILRSELDQLSAETDFLALQGAAVRYDWSPDQFADWSHTIAGPGLAAALGKDLQFDTRLQTQQWAMEQSHSILNIPPEGMPDVTAVPVYGPREAVPSDFPARNTFEIIMAKLPVPADDAPLEEICRLREQELFQRSLRTLRLWQEELMLNLLDAGADEYKRKIILRQAARQMDDWADRYREAMADARFEKVECGIGIVSALGKLLSPRVDELPSTLFELPEKLVKVRTIRRSCWKAANELECAPAGVIYWTEELMSGWTPA